MSVNEAGGVSGRLGSQAAFFLLGNVFTLLVGLPLQIYVARKLGTEGLGVFGLIEGGMGLVAGLVSFGLAPTLLRFIPAHLEQGRYDWIRLLVRRGLLLLSVTAGLLYAALLLGLPLLTALFPLLASYSGVLLLMGLLMPLTLLSYYCQQGLRGFQEIRYLVTGNSFLQLAIKAVLTVLLLSAGWGLSGYAGAVVLSSLAAFLWTAAGLWRKLAQMPSSREEPGQALVAAPMADWRAYASVMYSGSLLGMAGAWLDRFLLGFIAGATPVGILLVLKQLQQMPVIFLHMFLSVASPMFASAHARGAHDEILHVYHLTTDWVMRLSIPLLVFFMVFAEPLLQLYGGQFAREGVWPFRILLAGQLVNLGFGPVGHLMYMSGLEKRGLSIAVRQFLLTILGLLTLVPLWGLPGAAVTMFAGVLYINVAEYLASRDSGGLRWYDRRYLGWVLPTLSCLAVALAGAVPGQDAGPLALIAWLGALYAVFHGVSLVRGLHDDDRQLLGYLWSRLASGK